MPISPLSWVKRSCMMQNADLTVWSCGRNFDPYEEGKWELMGVFSSEARAILAAKRNTDWIAPIELNKLQRDERFVLPSYFPLIGKRPENV